MSDPKYGRLFTMEDMVQLCELAYEAAGPPVDAGQFTVIDLAKILDEVATTFPADEPLFLLRGQEEIASVRAVVEMWRRGDPAEIEGRNWSEFDHAILALDQVLSNVGRP